MNNNDEKIDNVKTIRELLGMDESQIVMPAGPSAPTAPAPALNLPVATWEQEVKEADPMEPDAVEVHEPAAVELEPLANASTQVTRFLSRDYVRYPLIFLVALGFFYVVLNFRGLSKQFMGFVNPPPANEEVVLGQDEAEYHTWIQKYYVYINNPDILTGNADPDRDGLTNMNEFRVGTNPLKRDTDRDGSDDGSEIIAGNNPLYEGRLPEYQRSAIASNVDLPQVQSRRDYGGQVAGESSLNYPIDRFVLDPSRVGQISIPKLGIDAPITWSKEFKVMEDDLKYGAAHHPQTPYPGERGTSSIHGHSSGNWDDGNFKTVFTQINFLEPGDEVFVTVHSTTGESRRYRYLVRSKKVYSKTDPAQFADMNGFFLNLSTSWPVGTARERYVVTTELAGL